MEDMSDECMSEMGVNKSGAEPKIPFYIVMPSNSFRISSIRPLFFEDRNRLSESKTIHAVGNHSSVVMGAPELVFCFAYTLKLYNNQSDRLIYKTLRGILWSLSMPEKKNQHYVPQFFLRRFANSGAKEIGLYNLRLKKFAQKASIKSQCSKNYFYGRDLKVENSLASLEGGFADCLNTIVESNGFPNYESQTHFSIIFFAVLQSTRTIALQNESEARAREFLKPLTEIKKEDFNLNDMRHKHWDRG